ncbi:MAG: hypothetical protein P9L97_07415 [Candidatus Tenebribacter davisii]|nr:hypothetical protein [Candidatus Tenebribacter davisii]
MELSDKEYYEHLSEIGSTWLSDFAYHGKLFGQNGIQVVNKSLCDQIAEFMDKYGIRKSEYGKIMDAIGKNKAFLHRLYEHHLIYDFPINNPENILDFLTHEFSDIFTKNGLPIIPGELLEDAPSWLRRITRNNNPCKNWNFLNGFDLLAGTIAIYGASQDLRKTFMNQMSVESLGDFARTLGVGVIELAIAISHANPLLLVGALMELTAGIKGIFNDGDIIYMEKQQYGLSLEFAIKNSSMEAALDALSVERMLEKTSIEYAIEKASRMSFE